MMRQVTVNQAKTDLEGLIQAVPDRDEDVTLHQPSAIEADIQRPAAY